MFFEHIDRFEESEGDRGWSILWLRIIEEHLFHGRSPRHGGCFTEGCCDSYIIQYRWMDEYRDH